LATYTVRRSKHATLVATTVDTVKFSTKPKTVEVRNLDATAVILFRSDGEVPAVNGDDTERLGPGERLEVDAAKQLGSLPRLNAGNYVESNTSGSDGHRVIYGFTLVGTEVEIAWPRERPQKRLDMAQPKSAEPAAGLLGSSHLHYVTRRTAKCA
jgi:hypothetical protein